MIDPCQPFRLRHDPDMKRSVPLPIRSTFPRHRFTHGFIVLPTHSHQSEKHARVEAGMLLAPRILTLECVLLQERESSEWIAPVMGPREAVPSRGRKMPTQSGLPSFGPATCLFEKSFLPVLLDLRRNGGCNSGGSASRGGIANRLSSTGSAFHRGLRLRPSREANHSALLNRAPNLRT